MRRGCAKLAVSLVAGLAWVLSGGAARADGTLHSLWELQGRHSTVFLLGSIHVLRPSDYPLAPAVLAAYAGAKALYMEVDLDATDTKDLQTQMLAAALMSEDNSLPAVLGGSRYQHASALAREVGVELADFDRFAPWFTAEAISQLQLQRLGFQPQSGVEMYFLERAHADGKTIAGLETIQEQIAVFQQMTLEAQAEYLVASLEQAHDLPREVGQMVIAWQRGDTDWFAKELQSDFGTDPKLYDSVLVARNRKWVPKIEALLEGDKNCLVIVGNGHLVGRDSVIDLLKKDGIGALQR